MPLYDEGRATNPSTYSGNPFIDGLLSGSQWASSGSTTELTISFPWFEGRNAFFAYGGEPDVAHGGVTAAQRTEILRAFQAWSNVANLTFREVTEDSTGAVGDLRLGFSEQVGDWWGWANYPGWSPPGGDIWVHTRYMPDSFAPGTYNYYATLHEIGHAVGLKHPFDGGTYIPAGYDSRLYTVMSYTDPATMWWYNQATGQNEYLIQSPMVYDILALQHLYGANMTFMAGSDTYMFDPAKPFIKAIWDAGGTDMIDLSSFSGACTLDLTPGSYSSLGFNGMSPFQNLGIAFNCVIENASGGAGDDTLLGNLAGNRLFGVGGHDVLNGLAGDDFLEGGAGDDRLIGADGVDTAIYDRAWAAVTVDLASRQARSTAPGDAAGIGLDDLFEIENVVGSRYDDLLLGDLWANRLEGGGGQDRLEGKEGDDVLVGGAGVDTLVGGGGDDRYVLTGDGDIVIEHAGEGSDTLLCDSSISLAAYANVECIQLTGSLDINATGNALSNLLTGNARVNRLYGLTGDDTLDGGRGSDTLYGGIGDDWYIVDSTSDAVIELVGEGVDTVLASVAVTLKANVEHLLQTGVYSITGRGNELANVMTGNSGSNRMWGMDGDDTLIGNAGSDQLDGGLGDDTLVGGVGNDIYFVDSLGDTTTENLGEGQDTVRTTISWTLGANIEQIELIGTGNISGAANDLNNIMWGNAGNNTLEGAGGNDRIYARAGNDTVNGGAGGDWLEGGAGQDTFIGGLGSDRYVFREGDFGGNTTTTADRILDFGDAEGDRIRLDLIDADTTVDGNQKFAWLADGAFTGTAGQLRYEQIAGNTYVSGDTNGDGIADFMIRVDGLHALGTDDFLF